MDDVEEIDLREILEVFWNKKLLIILLMFLGAILGAIYSKFIVVPKYNSSVTLILSKPISVNQTQTIDTSITQADILLNQKLISTYGEIVTSRKVVSRVIDNLNLDMEYEDLMKCISTTAVKDTDVVRVSVLTPDADLSADIVNDIVDVFSEEVVKIYNIQNVSIIDRGQADYEPTNVNLLKSIVIFVMVFFVIACGIVFLIYYFDNTVKTKDEIEKLLGVPVLATIPKFEVQKEEKKNAKRK